ncbi:MAG: LamG-like jellyroll fold domain-containing protein, partial [Dehalococcoidia bacterium]
FNGDPQWVAGHLGGALEFDGSGDYLDCGSDPSLDLTKWTIAFWLNLNENKDYNGYVIKGVDNTENYEVLTYGAGNFHFPILFTDGRRYVNSATGVTVVGEWAHFAYSYDSAEGRRLYKDGSLIFEDTESGTPQTSAEPLLIGNEGGTSRFVPGIMDDIRIYNRALTEAEIQQAMVGRPVELAYGPSPANEATDVPREVVLSWEPGQFAAPTNGHKVYFGESFNDVNDATDAVAQTAASYAPAQRLDFGTTYYWRVDEVNAPPTSQIEFKGEVWQFTTEPIAYAIDGNNITATASGTNSAEEGPENTINGSGLDANDLHSTEPVGMWLSSALDPNAAWLQYEFDRVYKLHQMRVWNNNTLLEPVIGFGVKDATIEYSVDGNNYTTLGTTHEFARASGAAGYAHNTTVDVGGVAVKYVRLTINSNWGGIVKQCGLSEVRFLYIPLRAREPQPESGATDVAVDVILGFRAGREAAERNVYLSSDEQAVIDGNAPVSTVTENSYSPSPLDVDSTYYWRVDEVNDAETTTTWQGDIWNFTTQESLVVDDFESYNEIPAGEEGSNLVYLTWIDGYENPSANGSTMGHTVAF